MLQHAYMQHVARQPFACCHAAIGCRWRLVLLSLRLVVARFGYARRGSPRLASTGLAKSRLAVVAAWATDPERAKRGERVTLSLSLSLCRLSLSHTLSCVLYILISRFSVNCSLPFRVATARRHNQQQQRQQQQQQRERVAKIFQVFPAASEGEPGPEREGV